MALGTRKEKWNACVYRSSLSDYNNDRVVGRPCPFSPARRLQRPESLAPLAPASGERGVRNTVREREITIRTHLRAGPPGGAAGARTHNLRRTSPMSHVLTAPSGLLAVSPRIEERLQRGELTQEQVDDFRDFLAEVDRE